MSDTRTIHTALTITDEEKTKDENTVEIYSVWNDTVLADRLNNGGIIISIVDETLSITSDHFPAFESFLSNIPTSIMGVFYHLVPSILPFVPTIYSRYCKSSVQSSEEPQESERNNLINYLMEDPQIRQELESKKDLTEAIAKRTMEFYRQDNSNKISLSINFIYFAFHAAKGIVLIANIGSPETKKEIFSWTSYLSNVANISYLFARGVQRSNNQKRVKKAIALSEVSQTLYKQRIRSLTSSEEVPPMQERLLSSPI